MAQARHMLVEQLFIVSLGAINRVDACRPLLEIHGIAWMNAKAARQRFHACVTSKPCMAEPQGIAAAWMASM